MAFFGQRPATTAAEAGPATLEVYAPERARGGLLYEARFTIEARRLETGGRISFMPKSRS